VLSGVQNLVLRKGTGWGLGRAISTDPRPSEDQEDQDSSWKLQIANATANCQLATCRTMEVGLNGSQSVRSVAIVGSRVFNYRP